VTQAVESFYGEVVQPLRPWVAPAPQLPDDVMGASPAMDGAHHGAALALQCGAAG
jgi:1,2-phenylacetyl-CoA epoxidase catalytic subunit